MTFLNILKVMVAVFIVFLIIPKSNSKVDKKRLKIEQASILENADILSRKVRYETMSFTTRIHQIIHSCFDSYKVIDNLVLEDENGVEHQIPLLCATSKGVILFQTVDYPGKGLFGNIGDEYWQIAQSEDVAQNVPNAVVTAWNNTALIKRITGIDVKPVTVISKYTPSAKSLMDRAFGRRIFKEENLREEICEMAALGVQNYPPEFITQVKDKFLAINIANIDDDEDIEDFENLEDLEDFEDDAIEEDAAMDENMELANA